ncbi:hypothetical protein VHEMI01750 [[Torrubiella] hemipterigena]|uniref:Allantoate permease n=1 Tax=[Torrubiella] hemipterigena TaxID=1531966 RepID=A0A0A1STZ6_9HYPO|nr:hypothetical protein VHEMI01750 [[Torrubiella] hemipterigena]
MAELPARLAVNGLGFSVFNTLLLSSVQYIAQLILVIIGTLDSTYLTNCRTLFMMWNYSIAISGVAMIRYVPAEMRWAKFAGIVMAAAFSANFPLVMSLMSGNFGGFSKKTTVNALPFIAYCAGNIVGPQLFFSLEKPTCNSGFFGVLVCMICAFSITLCIRLYLIRENHQRNTSVSSEQVQECMDAQADVMVNLMDRTDKEIPQFRYVY